MPLYRAPNEFHPGYIASQLYPLYDGTYNVTTSVVAVDQIYLFPFVVPSALPFTSIKLRTVTAGANSTVKAALWADSPVSHRPLGAPLFVQATSVATATSNTTIDLAEMASGVLTPNQVYWFGSKYTHAAGGLPVMANTSAPAKQGWLTGLTSFGWGKSFADAYGNAMPTFTEGASFTEFSSIVPVPFAQT